MWIDASMEALALAPQALDDVNAWWELARLVDLLEAAIAERPQLEASIRQGLDARGGRTRRAASQRLDVRRDARILG
jgi:hypothetical protein